MEPTVIISVAAIAIAVFSLMWQMNTNRMRDELLEAIRRNREEIRENRNAIRENRKAIRENRDAILSLDSRLSEFERRQARSGKRFNGTLNGRLSESEREQARLEGANRILGDVIRQRSHTHEGD